MKTLKVKDLFNSLVEIGTKFNHMKIDYVCQDHTEFNSNESIDLNSFNKEQVVTTPENIDDRYELVAEEPTGYTSGDNFILTVMRAFRHKHLLECEVLDFKFIATWPEKDEPALWLSVEASAQSIINYDRTKEVLEKVINRASLNKTYMPTLSYDRTEKAYKLTISEVQLEKSEYFYLAKLGEYIDSVCNDARDFFKMYRPVHLSGKEQDILHNAILNAPGGDKKGQFKKKYQDLLANHKIIDVKMERLIAYYPWSHKPNPYFLIYTEELKNEENYT